MNEYYLELEKKWRGKKRVRAFSWLHSGITVRAQATIWYQGWNPGQQCVRQINAFPIILSLQPLGNSLLAMAPKTQTTKRKERQIELLQIETFVLQRRPSSRYKHNPQNGRKDLQIIYLRRQPTSRSCKEHLQLHNWKKKNSLILK